MTSPSNCVSCGLKVPCIDHKMDCVIRTAVHYCSGMTGSPAGLSPRPNYVLCGESAPSLQSFSTNSVYCVTYLTKYSHVLVGVLCLEPTQVSEGLYMLYRTAQFVPKSSQSYTDRKDKLRCFSVTDEVVQSCSFSASLQ